MSMFYTLPELPREYPFYSSVLTKEQEESWIDAWSGHRQLLRTGMTELWYLQEEQSTGKKKSKTIFNKMFNLTRAVTLEEVPVLTKSCLSFSSYSNCKVVH